MPDGGTREAFDPQKSRLTALMAKGHQARRGHDLTGYYLTTDGITVLIRTCCTD